MDNLQTENLSRLISLALLDIYFTIHFAADLFLKPMNLLQLFTVLPTSLSPYLAPASSLLLPLFMQKSSFQLLSC